MVFSLTLPPTPAPTPWTIKPTFEHRARWERRIDRDFLKEPRDNRTDWHFRNRLGLVATDKSGNRITVVYQHSYDDVQVRGNSSVVTTSDVPYLNWERKTEGWKVTLGRQAYKLGDGRLISHFSNWGNLGRTFEGLRVQYGPWEYAGFKEAVNTPSNQEIRFGVLSNRNAWGLTSVIVLENGRPREATRLQTLNHLAKRVVGAYEFTLEGSGQWGRVGGRDHRAFMAVAKVERSFAPNLRAFAEATVSSGGSGPNSGTFDPMYPSPQLPHGLRTQAGLRNVKELTLGVNWRALPRLTVEGHWTLQELYDKRDGWYSLAGSLNRRRGGAYLDPTGRSGSRVGDYLQIEATYEASRRDTFAAGFGVFHPGTFIDRQLGGRATAQTWGYVQYRFRF